MLSLKLGSDGADRLIVDVYGRPDPNDDWLATRVSVQAGAFSGTFDATLMTCDFSRFRKQLQSLYVTLEGVASFDTIEAQLLFKCEGNGRGGVVVRGTVQDHAGNGNVLRFQFETDQTYLPPVIAELLDIEVKFPNRIRN